MVPLTGLKYTCYEFDIRIYNLGRGLRGPRYGPQRNFSAIFKDIFLWLKGAPSDFSAPGVEAFFFHPAKLGRFDTQKRCIFPRLALARRLPYTTRTQSRTVEVL